jgi:hypothetical protein
VARKKRWSGHSPLAYTQLRFGQVCLGFGQRGVRCRHLRRVALALVRQSFRLVGLGLGVSKLCLHLRDSKL